MAENRFPGSPCASSRETVCIETNRVMDSCRDRDCFENVRVYLSCYGNELLSHATGVRTKEAKIVSTNLGLEPIPFNCGFYAVTVRFYVKLTVEICTGCGRSQEVQGIAVLEKKVILYGGESNVNIFKSNGDCDGFCACPDPVLCQRNVPLAIVEAVDPVVLTTKILEKETPCNCCCCCSASDLPQKVCQGFDAPPDLSEGDQYLAVSLGIFSVTRIVRPAQYLVQATEYCIPEKECMPVEEDDPCRVFRKMPFPTGEFCTHPGPDLHGDRPGKCSCGS